MRAFHIDTGESAKPFAPPALRMNLRLFAGEKTEKATPKKRQDTRKEGQVAKSQEIGTAALFIVIFTALRVFAPYVLSRLAGLFEYNFALMADVEQLFTLKAVCSYISFCFLQVLIVAAPLLIVSLMVGLITNIIQVGWHPTGKPLQPKLSKLNPIKGFKRLFSMRALVDLVKSLAKFAIIGAVIYTTVKNQMEMLLALMAMDLFSAMASIANVCVNVGVNVGVLYLFIAAADYAYTRWKHAKDIRMSKQDIKDEYKNTEGDPKVKGKIKQKMREAAMRRMMHDVPSADVIITNPTHYAVALKYDKAHGDAPFVVAKGQEYLAKRIRDAGRLAGVPFVENPPLARALYAQVEIGREIPPALYEAVAEVLAYVYRLRQNTYERA